MNIRNCSLTFVLFVCFDLVFVGQRSVSDAFQTYQDAEPEELPLYQTHTIRIINWIDGAPYMANIAVTTPCLCRYEFFLIENEIVLELDPSKDQLSGIALLAKKISDQKNRINAGHFPSENDDYLEGEIRKTQAEIAEELKCILLPFQLRRLEEIEKRLAIRNHGIVKFLKLYSKQLGITLSDSELKKIKDAISKFLAGFGNQIENEMTRSMDKILEPLSIKQRRGFDHFHDSFASINDLDIYLAQLRYLVENAKSLDIGELDVKRFENLIEYLPAFHISFDGRFKATKSGIDQISTPSLIDELAKLDGNPLGLTSRQRGNISQFFEMYWKEVREHNAVRREEIFENGIESEHGNKVFNERMLSSADKLNRSCRSILSPTQSQTVQTLHARKLLIRYGQVANLMFGDLGRELKIDEKQRDKILETCCAEIDRLEGKLLKLDQDVLDAVKSSLTKDNKNKLETLIGRELRFVIPTYRMLLSSE